MIPSEYGEWNKKITMNTNLLNALKKIVSRHGGVGTLSDARRVKALLADIAAGEPKPQKNALTACIELGFVPALQNVSAGERGAAKTKLAARLNREEGLDMALCADTLDLLEAALFGGVSARSAPSATAAPGTPAPPDAYYLSVNYQQTGPFTLEQVKGMIGGGRVTKEYRIRATSGSNWMLVTAMPELKAFFANANIGAAPKPVAPRPQSPPQSPHDNDRDNDFDAYMACYDRGDKYFGQGDYDRAIREYTEAIRLKPNEAAAYLARACAYDEKQDYDRAIADYSKLIQLKPRDALVYFARGRAYYEKENYDKAIADYNEAVRLEPNDAMTYYSRGCAYDGKEDYDRAIADYSETIRLDPHHVNAYIRRGCAYVMKEDIARTRADWEEALRIDPHNTEARDWLNRLPNNNGMDGDDDDDFDDDDFDDDDFDDDDDDDFYDDDDDD
jgi:tetratricopeptide (TPR) repeat protein